MTKNSKQQAHAVKAMIEAMLRAHVSKAVAAKAKHVAALHYAADKYTALVAQTA